MNTRAMIVAAGLVLSLCGRLAAQDDATGDPERLVRDQRTIKARLEKIQTKMERLADKLVAEGKTRNAALLRKALAETGAQRLGDRIDEVIPDISASRFSSIERQEEILRVLESIYALLLDRSDLEKLEKRIEQVRAGLKRIEDLRAEEQRLIRETQSLAEDAQALLSRARSEVSELIGEQEQLASETDAAAGESRLRLSELKEALDELAARQAGELLRAEEAVESVVGKAAQRLDEALRAERSARERLDAQPAAAGADVEAARPAELSESQRAGFLDDQARARETLDRLLAEELGEEARGALEERIGPDVSRARAAAGAAAEAAERGDAAAAGLETERALAALENARAALARLVNGDERALPPGGAAAEEEVSAAAEDLAAQLEQQAGAAEEDAGTAAAAEEAAAKTRDAGRAAAAAAAALTAKEPLPGAEAERAALAALNEARAALDDPARAAAERASELSARQNYLQGGAQRLEETLGRLADLLDEEEQERAWLDLAEQAESEMRGAAESLARARLAQAAASQRSSLGSLQRLKEALDARSAGQEAQERQGKEQEEERYRDLAERQRALEEETRTLMDRLKDLENTAQQEALQDAASRMNQAASELDKQEGTAALPREEEAEKYLAQAQEELKDEEERYQELRQEGLLFKVREELEALRAGALELNDKTAEIDLERAQKSELTRSGRARARGLAADARALATRNDEVIEKIREDGALVFTFTLERNSEDLARIGDLLGTRPHATDEFTRSIVQDVVERYDDLLATLKEELERRRSAERQESPPGEEQRPRQQPLIPRVAELLMVKRMEEAALRKVDVFLRTHPELEEEGLDDVSRDRLQRLGGQHSEITRLFESLVESVPEEAADGGEPGPKEKR